MTLFGRVAWPPTRPPNRAGATRSLPLATLLFLLLPALLLWACRGQEGAGASNLALDVEISPTPPVVGPARLIITLTDGAGSPVDGAEVRVEGNMSHAGMVPVLDTAGARGQGLYVVPDFRFTMGGDWILTVTATLPDGRTTTVQEATGVGGATGGEAP